jgi:peptidoglycan/xylan/chitin deacetylase (PgdA/CDA1 family)
MRQVFARAATGLLAYRQRYRHGSRAVVLAYHRIAEPHVDPLGLCVSPGHFAEHLNVLRTIGVPCRLQDLPQALEDTDAPDRVCVSLDDGYADNLYAAVPLLAQFAVPATVFVVSGQHQSGREFWWDELARVILDGARLPVWPPPDDLTGGAVADASPSGRMRLFEAVHAHLYTLTADERGVTLDGLRKWAGTPAEPRRTHATLSLDELRRLAAHPLVEIGAHTVTHPALDRLDTAQQKAEVEGSKQWLESALNRDVMSFAYPHGRYTPATARLAREAGFLRACTVTPGSTALATDPWQVPRILVTNISGEVLAAWLRRIFSQPPTLPPLV